MKSTQISFFSFFSLFGLFLRWFTNAHQVPNSGQILTERANIAFTIYQAEYLNGANVNHWMLTVSQICEKLAEFQTSQKRNTTDYRDTINLFLHVSENKRKFFKFRNKEFAIRNRLKNSPFVRLTIRALSELYEVHFHFRGSKKIFRHMTKVFQYDVYASMGVDRSYACMNRLAHQILELCDCRNSSSVNSGSKGVPNVILVYNRKETREFEAGTISRLRTVLDAKSTEKNKGQYKIYNMYVPTKDPCRQFCIVSKSYKAIITPHGAQMAAIFASSPVTDIFEIIPPQYQTNGFNNYLRLSIPNRWYVVQEDKLIPCKSGSIDECYGELSESVLNCSQNRICQHRARSFPTLNLTEEALEKITEFILS